MFVPVDHHPPAAGVVAVGTLTFLGYLGVGRAVSRATGLTLPRSWEP
jgi:hypothetical protein